MRNKAATLAWIWIALLVLLALTAASAWLPLGLWNGIANLVIAAIKVALVALFFMGLARSRPVLRVVAIGALGTLALLLLLSGADFFTRRIYRAPWDQPPAGEIQPAPLSETRSDVARISTIRF